MTLKPVPQLCILRHRMQAFGSRGCFATIGNFDGVHVGHQALIAEVTTAAAAARRPAVLICFEPQPREFFARPQPIERLSSCREKLRLLAATGIDAVLLLRFHAGLAALDAEAFVRRHLVEQLGLRGLWVGDDFRFGRGRSGDYQSLIKLGQQLGFAVHQARTIELAGERVSSTRIREALHCGDLALAHRLLGHPLLISGRVVQGQQLGRKLGFPTANLAPAGAFQRPLSGIYTAWVSGAAAARLPAVVYVGTRPVLGGSSQSVEVHLLDYADDCYGRRLEVQFEQRLRPDQDFAGLEALKTQMQLDLAEARAFFAAHSPTPVPLPHGRGL